MSNIYSRGIITELIRSYYRSLDSIAPDKIEQREFGFGTFDDKIAFRHVAFKNEADFKKYLVQTAPLFADYSAAYYKLPDARPMERKEWLGSELRFDIDATDLPTECKQVHGKGWVCAKCLDAAKAETVKLVEDFLYADFGFGEGETQINFSGNRGYHVRVTNEAVLKFDANARSELSSYIRGSGIILRSMFPSLGERGKQLLGPSLGDAGWRGKIARGYSQALASDDSLLDLVQDSKLSKYLKRKKPLIDLGLANGNWDMVRIPKKEEVATKIAERIIYNKIARIDENVTKDPSHLMRLPNSIHGGSGLIAKKIPSLRALDKFEPMSDAIAFKEGELKVKANMRNSIVMNGQQYGPYNDETVVVPKYVATYLYLKDLADIVS